STNVKSRDEVIGTKVSVKVVKNRVPPPFRQAEFELSHERGISREADLLILAQDDKLIEKSGSWFNYGDVRLGQGAENVKQYLRDNPALMDELTRKILEKRGLVGNPTAPPSNGELAEEDTVVPTKGKRQTAAA